MAKNNLYHTAGTHKSRGPIANTDGSDAVCQCNLLVSQCAAGQSLLSKGYLRTLASLSHCPQYSYSAKLIGLFHLRPQVARSAFASQSRERTRVCSAALRPATCRAICPQTFTVQYKRYSLSVAFLTSYFLPLTLLWRGHCFVHRSPQRFR